MPTPQTSWFTYIVQCQDQSFYTGLTNDLQKRLQKHNSGQGSAYTRARLPVTLIYYETFTTHRQAAQREVAIKKLKRAEKEKLVDSFNYLTRT